MPYEMFVDGRRRDLGDRAYLLSPQDLAAYDLIGPLVQSVSCFKIEGRLKGRCLRRRHNPDLSGRP